jgi:methyl-accepting chemotaxis protein
LIGLSNVSVGKRLGIGFAIVVATMICVTAIGVSRVERMDDHLSVINDVNSVKQRYAINFRGSVHDRAISLRDVVLAETDDEVARHIADIDRLATAYAESAVKLTEIFADPAKVDDEERAAHAEIERIEQATMPVIDEVIELRTTGDRAGATALLAAEASPLFTDWLRSINVLIDLEEAKNQTEGAAVSELSRGFLQTMVILASLATLLAVIVAWRIARSITHPMADAVRVFKAVADGDLTQRLSVEAKGGLGEMGGHANEALEKFAEAMTAVVQSADEVARASVRIDAVSHRIVADAEESSAQANNVATSAAEVSRNVHSTAVGSEEMGASIREIAATVNDAARVATQAVAASELTSETVVRLGESSRQINDVVEVIASIAEQTNLLALNASIEAARVGELGQGFAVVANEVKELALETGRATATIAERGQAIQADSTSAVQAIGEVSSIISAINEYQATIAAAVEQQSATTGSISAGSAVAAEGSARIADSIGGVARAADSTKESVDESLRAVNELSVVSSRLQAITAQFTIDRDPSGVPGSTDPGVPVPPSGAGWITAGSTTPRRDGELVG